MSSTGRGAKLFLLIALIAQVNSHGRLMKPVNRSSVWRIREFQSLNPRKNYDDNQLFCGGIHQKKVVGGNCGVCGDRYTDPIPRENERGGKYDKGIITGRYTEGGIIDIEVELTKSHMGYMEFRLCTDPSNGETQDCFNRHILQRADGKGSKTMPGKTGWYKVQYRLPAGVTCAKCTLQWNYRAGNDWGRCPDGSGKLGCGPQETFRGCSDIAISRGRNAGSGRNGRRRNVSQRNH